MMTKDLPVTKAPQDLKTFLIIWLGEFISILGSGLSSFALGVWIYAQTGQATPFAITVLVGTLPRLLLTPLAGSLADRWSRRWLMILADTGCAVVTLGAVILMASGEIQVWHIYLISALSSAFSSFQGPAYTASITMLVPKKHLARASGMMQMSESVQLILSPILAGFLFGAIGLKGIFLIDFVTFFFAVGALLVVRIPQPKVLQEQGQKPSMWRDLAFGWNYLRLRPGMFGLLWFFALTNFLLNIAGVLLGPLVLSFSDASAMGISQAVAGIGMLAGSIVISAWGGPKRRIAGVLGFIAMDAVGLALIGVKANVTWISMGMFLALAAVPMASGCAQAIFQTKTEPSVQGRVFGVRSMISQSIMPLAFLLAGPLADVVFDPLLVPGGSLAGTFVGSLLGVGPGRGMGLIFVLSGLTLVAATLLVTMNPRIRRIEVELPDAVVEEGEEVVQAEAVAAGG